MLPLPTPLILASQSPRRQQLLAEHDYTFQVDPPDDDAESGFVEGETPAQLVLRHAQQKAANVAARYATGLIIGCDTVAECDGEVLGKPNDRSDAKRMLTQMRGRAHRVLSGLCLHLRPSDRTWCDVVQTELTMADLSDEQLELYLDDDAAWRGKAGAFGFQDGLDWVRIDRGSESNVVGLPMERLAELLAEVAAVMG